MVYFVYHALEGDRGFRAHMRLEQDLAEIQALRQNAEAERLELEQRVALLRPENLDPDMLEERARTLLNLGHADEVVLYYTPDKAKSKSN